MLAADSSGWSVDIYQILDVLPDGGYEVELRAIVYPGRIVRRLLDLDGQN